MLSLLGDIISVLINFSNTCARRALLRCTGSVLAGGTRSVEECAELRLSITWKPAMKPGRHGESGPPGAS